MEKFSDAQLHDLAMLYLQNQDLNGLNPKDIFQKYYTARSEFETAQTDIRKELGLESPTDPEFLALFHQIGGGEES